MFEAACYLVGTEPWTARKKRTDLLKGLWERPCWVRSVMANLQSTLLRVGWKMFSSRARVVQGRRDLAQVACFCNGPWDAGGMVAVKAIVFTCQAMSLCHLPLGMACGEEKAECETSVRTSLPLE